MRHQLALDRAGAALGSTTASGIFLLGSSDADQVGAYALRGEFTAQSDKILVAWQQQLADSTPGKNPRNGHGGSHPDPLLTESRSLLSAPILEGRRILGEIRLESTRRGAYMEEHRRWLEEMAASMLRGIFRHVLTERIQKAGFKDEIIGNSAAFLDLEAQIKAAVRHRSCSVMIHGERGTGKELTARAIHCLSGRWQKPFIPVLASAFSPELFAAELFGHEKGAFTGAESNREGKFSAADGGTIFFDEVADLSLNIQSALLRVIERGELPRVGRDHLLQVDVRVTGATNRDLERLMSEGKFRRDLFDRLSAFRVCLSSFVALRSSRLPASRITPSGSYSKPTKALLSAVLPAKKTTQGNAGSEGREERGRRFS